jgi:hypothetical protein
MALEAIDLSGWQKVMERIAKDMHEGRLKPGQLDESLVKNIYAELNEAAGSGYGKNWNKLGNDAAQDRSVLHMQRNLYRFSGAKSFTELEQVNSAQYKDGKSREFNDFLSDVLKINDTYNITHKQAEWQTARQSGHSAREYQQFVADIKIFPNVRFKTVGDKRVRESHKKLEGTIVPINSEFLRRYMTPLDYRCRCRWVQTAEKVSKYIPDTVEGVKPEFIGNVGITNEVFPEQNRDGGKAHPHFAILRTNTEAVRAVERLMVKNFREEVRTWAKEKIVKANKAFKHKELPEGFKVSGIQLKSITGKPHADQFERNNLLYNLEENFKTAEFISKTPEIKGRPQYKMWYYFKDQSGNFFYNVVEMADGSFILHAITDSIHH